MDQMQKELLTMKLRSIFGIKGTISGVDIIAKAVNDYKLYDINPTKLEKGQRKDHDEIILVADEL